MAITENEFNQAQKRAQRLRDKGHALEARFDPERVRIVVKMNTGVEIAFPPALAQGLAGASSEDLARIEITPSGLGLHWPTLDADLYVPALLAGVLGDKHWMAAQLGAQGGRARSAAKAHAARTNGRLGGRPRKRATS